MYICTYISIYLSIYIYINGGSPCSRVVSYSLVLSYSPPAPALARAAPCLSVTSASPSACDVFICIQKFICIYR